MRYIQLLQYNNNLEVSDCLGTLNVRVVDGRYKLDKIRDIAEQFFKSEKTMNSTLIGYEIREGANFSEYTPLERRIIEDTP